jgi:hypothetical protein
VPESHASQAHFQSRAKPILRQLTFDPVALYSIGVHHENGRRPQRIKAMKPGGMFLNVSFERNKVLMDKVCDFVVAVCLGFQPSTGTSGRRGREINQQGFVLSFGFGECCVHVFLPIN